MADRLGRDAILIELNPEYAVMAQRRIEGDAGMFAAIQVNPLMETSRRAAQVVDGWSDAKRDYADRNSNAS